jgi:hypothetical protein
MVDGVLEQIGQVELHVAPSACGRLLILRQ